MQQSQVLDELALLKIPQISNYEEIISQTTLTLNTTYTSELLMIRARAYLKLGKPLQCIKDCEAALKQGGAWIDIEKVIIAAHLEMGDYLESENRFNKIVKAVPSVEYFLSVYQAIERLKLNSNFHKLSHKEESILGSLRQWLYKGGAFYEKLKIVNLTPHYRGVIATKHIKKKQRIVFIPHDEMITLEMAKKVKLCQYLIEDKIQLLSPKHTYLSILILEENCKPTSKWRLYLDILPKDFTSFPINYTKEELAELVGSNFLYQIREKVLDLKRDYDTIVSLHADFEKYTFKSFCQARMIIGSRIFGVMIDGVKSQALVPFADMLNHKVPKQTVWNYSQELRGFMIESLQDIMPGEQVFDSYGRKCNSRFLLNYGFVLPNNPQNQICFRVGFHKTDTLYDKKTQMMKDACEGRVFKITAKLQQSNFYELMGFLRFYNISDIQTLEMLEKISGIKKTHQPYKPNRTPPISIEVELLAWSQLKQYCQQALQAFQTTLTQDLQLLKSQLTPNMFNIVTLRSGEKQLFHNYQNICNEVIQLLKQGKDKVIEFATKNTQSSYCRYLSKIMPLMLPGQIN